MYQDNQLQTEEKSLSILGIGSIIIAVLSGLGMLLMFSLVGYFEWKDPNGMNENETFLGVIGLIAFGLIALYLIGAGIGIAGLVQQNIGKLFPAIGVFLNLIQFLIITGIIVVGILIG